MQVFIIGITGGLTTLSTDDLARIYDSADAVVFTAGAGGGGDRATTAIDGDGARTAVAAAEAAGVERFLLVSVFPEAWRERHLGAGFDHYISVKKDADIAVSQSTLDWVILRPAVLTDEPGQGTSSWARPVGIPRSPATTWRRPWPNSSTRRESAGRSSKSAPGRHRSAKPSWRTPAVRGSSEPCYDFFRDFRAQEDAP